MTFNNIYSAKKEEMSSNLKERFVKKKEEENQMNRKRKRKIKIQ